MTPILITLWKGVKSASIARVDTAPHKLRFDDRRNKALCYLEELTNATKLSRRHIATRLQFSGKTAI